MKTEQPSELVSGGSFMSKGTLSLAALMLLVVGFPVVGMVVAGHPQKPKKDNSFHREFYPDEHLFV